MKSIFERVGLATMAIALGIALLAIACSDRPRNNPFDPKNPDPVLRTAGFNALAGNGEVLLYWDPIDYVDVKGLQVERTLEGSSEATLLNDTILPLDRLAFRDNKVDNGSTYTYRLRLVLKESPERPGTESDQATPGELFPWVSNYDRTEVTRVTPDFRDERYNMEIGFNFVADIQFKPDNSEIWVLDSPSARIYRFYNDGTLVPDQGNLGQNSAFRFNQYDRSLWLASWAQNSTVFHLRRTGDLEASYRTDVLPTWICLDIPGDGAWVASSDGKILYLQDGEIHEITHSAFISPEKVVSGVVSSTAWVLDYDAKAIFHLTIDRVDWNLQMFSNPQDIATDMNGDMCWVADMDADVVYLIDVNKKVLAQVHNMGRPTDLTFNAFDNTVVVTGANGTINAITVAGTVLWSAQLPHSPGQVVFQ